MKNIYSKEMQHYNIFFVNSYSIQEFSILKLKMKLAILKKNGIDLLNRTMIIYQKSNVVEKQKSEIFPRLDHPCRIWSNYDLHSPLFKRR